MVKSEGRVCVFGIEIDSLTMRQAVARVAGWINSDERLCRYVVTPNVDHIVRLREDGPFRETYGHAALVLVDGKPVAAAARFLGETIPETVSGSDLVPEIFEHFSHHEPKGVTVFLLGAGPGVAERAAERIHATWPGVRVVGTLSPDFGFERDRRTCEEICAAIAKTGAELLVIGLGCPKQELWVRQYAQRLPVKVALCVGAAIDFLAGEKRRAPPWMRRLALEWFHRVLTEPRRLGKRYLQDAVLFPLCVVKEWRSRN